MGTQLAAVSGREPVDVLALIDHFAMGGAQLLLSQFALAAPAGGIRLSVAYLIELERNAAAAALRDVGLAPVNLNVPGRPGLASLRTVRRHLARLRPAIVHTHLGTADMLGGIAARSLRIPQVSTLHSVAGEADLETQVKQRILKRTAARIIAVSRGAAEAYAAHGWTRGGQLVTIHNGIDVTAEPGSGRAVRAELGIGEDELLVGMISSLRREKAHDAAVAAVRLLLPAVPRLRLLIAGQGPLVPEITRQAADLGDRVVFSGMRGDVMACFDACDVCLHPSRIDAFPTTLIEAMAASVPVLATAVGGIPEIVEDGRTGVLIPPPPTPERIAAGLSELLGDPARRAALGAAGRRVYEQRFTADPWIRSTRALYDEVLAGG